MAGTTRSSSSSSLDLGPGPGLDPAHVEQVGAVLHQLLGAADEVVEREGGALVVEGVGGAVEDAHHQGPVGDVEGPLAEARGWSRHGADATATPPTRRRRRPGRSEEPGGQALR